MIRHYLKMVLRIMKKRPGIYLINIFGLAVGIAACLLITHYVQFNKSYDTQSPYHEDTYRVLYTRWMEMGDRVEFASCSPPVGPMIKEQFPEVETYSRMFRREGIFFKDDVFFEEENVFYAESPIFDILGIKVLSGDGQACLDKPGQIAISRTTAKKYFGDSNPMGELMHLNKREPYEVTAVFEDTPPNMHFIADIFISLATFDKNSPGTLDNGWVFSGFYTYTRLKPGTDPQRINKGIKEFIDREFGESLAQRQMGLEYTLQPLGEIHQGSRLMHELKVNNDKTTIGLLSVVSWFILLIAWVNFFNLNNIASLKRLREIGVRKVSGARRKQLLMQFLVESVIVNLLALLLALAFVEVAGKPFNEFAGMPRNMLIYTQPWFFFILAVIFTAGTLSAGIFTGIGIAGTNLVNTLKGTHNPTGGGKQVRKMLVAFQFAIAIALIAATMGVYSQYNFMLERDLGFQLNKKLVLKAPVVGDRQMPLKFTSFRNELKQIDGIENASFSSIIPGKSNMFNRGGFYRKGDSPGDSKNLRVTEADNEFFETLGIKFLAGEGFTGNPEADRDRVVINLNAARLFGFEDAQDAVGDYVYLGERSLYISGVVVDFFQMSPKEVIEPQMFWFPVRNQGYFTINYNGKTFNEILEQVEPVYRSFFPANPFDYFLLDDYYNRQFQHDRRFGMVFALFSLLVIIVTILGLIGLSAFTAEQRRKEIGIRKVLGANRMQIFYLLFRHYILLWIGAGLVGVPLVVAFLRRWLEGFAVRIDIDPWLFFAPLAIVLLISLFTVMGVSRRILKLNPVENISAE